MQFPSSKVVFAALAALALAAAEQLADDGLPHGVVGWLTFAGKVLGAGSLVGGAGYAVTENRPSAQLVARVRAGELPR